MRRGERGIALITTLILGLISLVVVGVLLYLLVSSTTVSGIGRRYTGALEAAKGVSEYIMEAIYQGSLTCGGGICSPGDSIDLDPYAADFPGYTIRATYLGGIERFGVSVHAVRVEARKNNTDEQAVVEFVYRVE